MEPALQIYRQRISEQPVCDDSWFGDQIAASRQGDESASRRISGSCLRLALQIAEDRAGEFPDLTVLDLAQEANVGLIDAIKSFPGTTATEFQEYASRVIHQSLDGLRLELLSNPNRL